MRSVLAGGGMILQIVFRESQWLPASGTEQQSPSQHTASQHSTLCDVSGIFRLRENFRNMIRSDKSVILSFNRPHVATQLNQCLLPKSSRSSIESLDGELSSTFIYLYKKLEAALIILCFVKWQMNNVSCWLFQSLYARGCCQWVCYVCGLFSTSYSSLW